MFLKLELELNVSVGVECFRSLGVGDEEKGLEGDFFLSKKVRLCHRAVLVLGD